ncbi:DUF397 domain-containing protein [Streptomyces iconiensis]|uniref:DUF397 domain-containing protein n=1 Tax=Streptomyces iconiensis TaxID=1384038 RepID=A0ABT6ZWW1_9ACTN|nr:DUF397 domain-containing protein [Streptomyces iconiensis]MDJ1133544.1 DUF397 domain-containing protein [Streptomyces iconiensis]
MSTRISNSTALNAQWTKSSYSAAQSDCVEIASLDAQCAVRDSKNPNGPALVFSREGFHMFVTAVKQGGAQS